MGISLTWVVTLLGMQLVGPIHKNTCVWYYNSLPIQCKLIFLISYFCLFAMFQDLYLLTDMLYHNAASLHRLHSISIFSCHKGHIKWIQWAYRIRQYPKKSRNEETRWDYVGHINSLLGGRALVKLSVCNKIHKKVHVQFSIILHIAM